MFYSRSLILAMTLLSASLSHAQVVETETKPVQLVEQFSALPATCITLRQGRKCFTTITISLTLTKVGDYCIYRQGFIKPMRCWYSAAPKIHRFAFESAEKTVYTLKNEQSQQVVAETAVEVSWVHKMTSRKRRWRIF
ncbi:MAG: DUF3019 domain-containing protein [Gammaproteobacteria bacterium]|nr:DUF3019 domain-containing protein [Gammaproteobacteria bacterium]